MAADIQSRLWPVPTNSLQFGIMRTFLADPESGPPASDGWAQAAMPASGPSLTFANVLSFFLMIGIFTVSWHIARPGDINFTISDAAFLVVILGLVGTARLNLAPLAGLSPALIFSIIVMLGALFVSTLINGDIMRWLIVAVQYSFAYLLLPMMLASFDHKTRQRAIVFYILGVTFSQAIGNIAGIFFDWTDTAPYLGNNFITGMGRLGAFSGNPNNNCAMAGFALVLLIYAVDRKLMNRLLSLICGVFLLWGIIASASFGGFVISLSAVSLVLIIHSPKWATVTFIAVIAFVSTYFASGLPLPAAFEQRVYGSLSGGGLEEAGTFAGRMELAEEAWAMAGDTLLIGIGADSFRVVSMHQAPVHVFPLLLLTEAGLLGLIGFVGVLGVLWFRAMTNISADYRGGFVCVGVLMIFTLFTLTVPHMYARLWLAPVFLALLTCVKVKLVQQELLEPGQSFGK